MGENPAALRAAVFSLSSKNPRGGGGGRSNAPPPAGRGLIRAALGGKYYLLPDIGYNLKTAQNNNTKLSVPYPTLI